ncbi:GAF domain-containing protein [Hyphomonadaceae bacterium BL14]|nr:GAF domain-containing protein [Hyphomonadaceae bacterium BL14]
MSNPGAIRLDDPRRLVELERFQAAALAADSQLPEIIEAARYAFRGTLAALSCVGPEVTTFPWIAGVPGENVPTCHAFCRRVVETGEPFIAKNLTLLPDYVQNPYVASPPYMRFYAGIPVRSPSGFVLGAFAILNHEPSVRFDSVDFEALQRFASIAMGMVNMHADLRAVA